MAKTHAEYALSTGYLARKGDVVAIEHRHSSTYVHGKTVRHRTYHIGRATSVRRDGFVKSASAEVPTGSGTPFLRQFSEWDRQHNGWAAFTISTPELRAAAEKLIPCSFDSAEALKAAILAAAEG